MLRCLGLLMLVPFVLGASPAHAAGFASPSGNIRCYIDIYSPERMDDVSLICLIFDADWPLPPYHPSEDGSCDLDSTRAVVLPRTGKPYSETFCHGDVFWPAPLGAISYGSEWSLMGYTCTMATDGVRCTNDETGRNIHVRRAAVNLN